MLKEERECREFVHAAIQNDCDKPMAKVLYGNMNPNFVWEQAATHKMWLSQADALIAYLTE